MVIIPVIDIVGVADIASEKAAVIVTLVERGIKLSSSVSLRITVGCVPSNVKVMLSIPA